MAQVWEVWKCDAYEKTTDADARTRLKDFVKDLRVATGAEVKVMSGWYGEDNSFVILVQHGSFEDFANQLRKFSQIRTGNHKMPNVKRIPKFNGRVAELG